MICRVCGASARQRKDQVSDTAIAYTCSRCLILPQKVVQSRKVPK